MFAIGQRLTKLHFQQLGSGDLPLFEGADQTIRVDLRGPFSHEQASRAVVAETLCPKPKPFVFVAWRQDPNGVTLGFAHDPALAESPSTTPRWFAGGSP